MNGPGRITDNCQVIVNRGCAGDGVTALKLPTLFDRAKTRVHRKVRTWIMIGVARVIMVFEGDEMPGWLGFTSERVFRESHLAVLDVHDGKSSHGFLRAQIGTAHNPGHAFKRGFVI